MGLFGRIAGPERVEIGVLVAVGEVGGFRFDAGLSGIIRYLTQGVGGGCMEQEFLGGADIGVGGVLQEQIALQ